MLAKVVVLVVAAVAVVLEAVDVEQALLATSAAWVDPVVEALAAVVDMVVLVDTVVVVMEVHLRMADLHTEVAMVEVVEDLTATHLDQPHLPGGR